MVAVLIERHRGSPQNLKTILVTGGAGSVGSVTAERLLEKNENIVVLDDRGHSRSVAH
jgi:nucleoside-diphosphate-sugar epimerase